MRVTVATAFRTQFVASMGSTRGRRIDGAVYKTINDNDLQVNSPGSLNESQYSMLNGVADNNRWSHTGLYMYELPYQHVLYV